MSRLVNKVLSLGPIAAAAEINKQKDINQRRELWKEWRKAFVAPEVAKSLTDKFDVDKFIDECIANKVKGIKPGNASGINKGSINKAKAVPVNRNALMLNGYNVVDYVEYISLNYNEIAIDYTYKF